MAARSDATDRWLTVAEAAAVAGVSRQAVYGWAARGRLALAPTDGGRIAAGELSRLLAVRRVADRTGLAQRTLRRIADAEAA